MYPIQLPVEKPVLEIKVYLENRFGGTAVHTGEEGQSRDTILAILAPYDQRKKGETTPKVLYNVNPHLGEQEELLDKFTKKVTITPVGGEPLSELNVKEIQQELAGLN